MQMYKAADGPATQAYSEGMNEHERCTLYVVECAVDLFEFLGSEI